ncbi:MAG: hypothetical protein QME83_06395 [Thermodesulfobacteriota bacterium]|nr:hypothetical protein [Thermodesulfobacteriota bacterium]
MVEGSSVAEQRLGNIVEDKKRRERMRIKILLAKSIFPSLKFKKDLALYYDIYNSLYKQEEGVMNFFVLLRFPSRDPFPPIL